MVTLGILSPGTLRKSPEQRCAGALAGSGPFVLDRVALNEEVRLSARTGYAWASQLAAHKGVPRIRELTFAIVTDPSARHGSLFSGQLDADLQVLQQDQRSFGRRGPGCCPPPVPASCSRCCRTSRGPLMQAAAVVLAAYTFTFAAFTVLPADPVQIMIGPQNGVDEARVAALRTE
ncbi:ABC transporter substrate-binding protein [Actinomadura sp. WMMA1423]|uniref:ABC transporter substrate-binding protein n=1 Tax=Actinomadura sp. WMMA1423 TaxID=2591108 RepID=UPI00114613F7|nr:ABC transporter substrate-binding protein [Actinomadura sp. WMMA1423]